jgi:hypothetical protein
VAAFLDVGVRAQPANPTSLCLFRLKLDYLFDTQHLHSDWWDEIANLPDFTLSTIKVYIQVRHGPFPPYAYVRTVAVSYCLNMTSYLLDMAYIRIYIYIYIYIYMN